MSPMLTMSVFSRFLVSVTAVERASTALQILTESQAEFDLLIADVYLADVDALTLIRLAADMGLQVMCEYCMFVVIIHYFKQIKPFFPLQNKFSFDKILLTDCTN